MPSDVAADVRRLADGERGKPAGRVTQIGFMNVEACSQAMKTVAARLPAPAEPKRLRYEIACKQACLLQRGEFAGVAFGQHAIWFALG